MKKEKNIMALSMFHFGINSSVLTDQANLEKIIESFIKTPDSKFYDGRGKKFMHHMLKKRLLNEDAYFDRHIEEVDELNDRWLDFMDDCLVFVALDYAIYRKPIALIHPSDYQKLRHPDMPPSKDVLTLIEGISTLN